METSSWIAVGSLTVAALSLANQWLQRTQTQAEQNEMLEERNRSDYRARCAIELHKTAPAELVLRILNYSSKLAIVELEWFLHLEVRSHELKFDRRTNGKCPKIGAASHVDIPLGEISQRMRDLLPYIEEYKEGYFPEEDKRGCFSISAHVRFRSEIYASEHQEWNQTFWLRAKKDDSGRIEISFEKYN